jgi:hypothetical protein
MDERKQLHRRKEQSDGLGREPRPYWQRVHHDWRFWVGLTFMLAAISVYVLSDDLAFPFLPRR